MLNKIIYQFPKLFKANFCNLIQKSTQKLENTTQLPHMPVLCETAIQYLLPGENKTIIDMTFGAGGHSRQILNHFPDVKIYALDCDPISYNYAKELQAEYPEQIVPLLGKFSDLPVILRSMGEENISVDGILFDFGCSSMQFDEGARGFSLSKNGPLDMRMNNTDSDQLTAAEVLSKVEESDLVQILKVYGEEKQAKKIARSIIHARSLLIKINTTKQLADIVENCFTDSFNRMDKLQRPAHSATKTFQALRIFVNNELNEINFGISLAYRLLKLNGRLVTISFHSLEDTIVKRHLQSSALQKNFNSIVPLKYCSYDLLYDDEVLEDVSKIWKQLHKHVITPSDSEVKRNPRSRSAKLRASEKIS